VARSREKAPAWRCMVDTKKQGPVRKFKYLCIDMFLVTLRKKPLLIVFEENEGAGAYRKYIDYFKINLLFGK
jgi:hypothetical protein